MQETVSYSVVYKMCEKLRATGWQLAVQSQSQQKGAGMCARLFYIPQKFRGPTGMCWQRQELTQVAQGREQVGLFAAEITSSF